MKKLEISEIRNLNELEMQTTILEIKRVLLEFRIKKATRQIIKPHCLKAYKNQLARIKTIYHEKYNITEKN